jgi:hypothetical protein
MPLANLIGALEQAAEAEALAVREAARVRVEQLEAEAARVRAERSAEAARSRGDVCQAEADQRLVAAQRATRARVLTARAELLERVHAAVRARLLAAVPRVASDLAQAALACGDGRARCHPSLAPFVPGASVDEALSGVVIDQPSGNQIVATLDALLAREWPRLAATVITLVEAP